MSTTNRPPSVYVDDVFDEVLALPEDQRELAIEARCSGHPSLAAEVRALLDAEADEPVPPPEQIHAGARLGRYQLESCLGKGASASVWKAWDTHLRAWTALKLLRSDISHRESALQTVLHEARAASAIISDHVVRIKAAGKIPAGPYYVEMQLCAEHSPDQDGDEALVIGQSLAEVAPRSVREAARLVMEAARGAEAAHRVGVLHRDIKPANVLLMPISRRALVADFGLSAAQVYPEAMPGTPSTATVTIHLREEGRVLVGTPSFMPPEQAWGEPAARTNDVYALGATLYALIARRAPYQPSGERPLPALEVVRMVRQGPPRPLEWTARQVPSQLVRIVEKAMARKQADRYPTAASLAADLDCFLRNVPSSVDGKRPWLSVGLFVKRNWPVVSAASLMIGAVSISASAVVALELRRVELTEANAVAEQRLVAAQEQTAGAERVRDEAEGARDVALTERDSALEARNSAQRARDLAMQGQTKAEKRALEELEARRVAEADRVEALKLKLEAEDALARQERLRLSVEGELESVREQYATQAAEAEWLRGQLELELTENKKLEGDLAAVSEQVLDLRAKMGVLQAEADLARAGAQTAREALEAVEREAPWMDTEPAAPAQGTPP